MSEIRADFPSVVGEVAAGFPSPAAQYLEEPLDLNELLVHRPAATFYLRVEGESMTGAGIWPGDILVVDRSLEARDGAVVVASTSEGFTVKFLRLEKGGAWLLPSNPAYSPLFCGRDSELQVFGVVTASIHQFVRGTRP